MRWPGVEHMPRFYDAFMALSDKMGLGRWRKWLAGGAHGRVLEVGCGTGRNLVHYPADARVVGLDVSFAPLRKARRRAPGVALVQASAEALPFKTGVFDTAVSGLCFCSVPDPRLGLREVRRVLASGGALRMMEHVRSRSSLWARFQDRITPAWRWFTGGCNLGRETEKNVEASGFTIEAATRREQGTMRRFEARPA